MKHIASIVFVLAALGGFDATPAEDVAGQESEITLASGTLAHHRLTNDLFHIDDLWMKVAPDTEFHRWLSQGVGRTVSVVLTSNVDRFADIKNVRLLSGTLIHETAPTTSPVVHMLFFRDERTASLGAVTFQTDDLATAMKFDSFEGEKAGVIIAIG